MPSFAQRDYTMPSTETNVPQNLHTLTQGLLLDLLSAATCQLGGVDFMTPNHKCLVYNSQGRLSYADNSSGVVGFLTNAIQITYTPPLHTSYYVAYLKNNFGLVKSANAAGNSGFDQLQPLTKIWLIFRNLTYLLYVIIFVVIGFAIMLRAKIDPRTVMTIENQIPKLIVSIVLITFSFAIAGLLIDFLWVLMYLVVNVFAAVDPNLLPGNIISGIRDNPIGVYGRIQDGSVFGLAWQVAGALNDMLNVIIGNALSAQLGSIPVGGLLSKILAILPPFIITATLPCVPSALLGLIPGSNTDFGKCIDGNMTAQLSFLGAIVAYLIVLVAMVVALFKIWFTLIQSYAMFLILVATGPLFILSGVLPGSKVTFEWWLRQLLAYLSSFIVTLGILLLGKVLMDAFGNSTNAFGPPLIGGQIGQVATSTLGAIIGFATFLLVPQALTMARDAIGATPIKYLQGIGEGLGAGTKFVGGVAGAGFRRAFHDRNLQTGQGEGFGTQLLLGRIDEAGTWSGKSWQGFLRRMAYGKMKGMK